MFDELLKEYQKLTINSKKEKVVEELKLVIAMLQLLCNNKNIKYPEIKIKELNNMEDDGKYFDLIYSYVTLLKEELGSYVINNEEKK